MPLVWLVALSALQARPQEPVQRHVPPAHPYDLIHVEVNLSVDPAVRRFGGYVIDVVTPLQSGLASVTLDAGPDLNISRVTVDGKPAKAKRKRGELDVFAAGFTKGKQAKIRIEYSCSQANAKGWAGGFGASTGGWHWVESDAAHPDRTGFWTLGWPLAARNWAPTWAAPNDLATSETSTTVPADWLVIGNGRLVANRLSADHKKRTWVWKMDQPHATYLLSLVGGPLAYIRGNWNGVDLWYVGYKSDAAKLAPSFAHVPDMLDFFSKRLGVPYPWKKLAEDAMDDFSGGMENVTAVTLDARSLITQEQAGNFADPSPVADIDGLVSHELAHQWFGDLATYQDWGDSWLSEGFATFMEGLYAEHSRGENAYRWRTDEDSNSYFREASREERPISTQLYARPTSTFDATAYDKGAVILHTLRRYLGDAKFFAGLKHYLTVYRHKNVVSAALRDAMSQSSGVDLKPFWSQWIDKPGHPVLQYEWSYSGGAVTVEVSQVQDRSKGAPLYEIPATIGLIVDGKLVRKSFTLAGGRQAIAIETPKPDAVLLDPDHDFLREIRGAGYDRAAAPLVARLAPDPEVRTAAFEMMLQGTPTAGEIREAAALIAADNGSTLVFRSLEPLARLRRPELRDLFVSQLRSPNPTRVAQARAALDLLGK